MTDQERIDALLRHINLVRENCGILAEKYIARGDFELAKGLLKIGFLHDSSKFSGIEWQFLTDPHITNRAGLKYAVEHHQRTNPHHSEYWPGGLKEMPLLYKCEMVADIVARAAEMGTSARDYINNIMPKRYNFPKAGELHNQLVSLLDMLCPQPFEPIETEINAPSEMPVLQQPVSGNTQNAPK